MSRPAVSVIVIDRGEAPHLLRETLLSIHAQSHTAAEIVVVRTGSAVESSISETVLRQVRTLHQVEPAPFAACNSGLAAATSELVQFVSAGDRLRLVALQLGAEQLSSNTDCMFVAGHHRQIDVSGNLVHEPRWHEAPATYEQLLRGERIGWHSTVMYRRAALQRLGGWDVAFGSAADLLVQLRLASQFPFARYKEVVADCRMAPCQPHDSARALRDVLRALDAHRRQGRLTEAQQQAWRVGRRAWQRHYVRQHFSHGGAIPGAMPSPDDLVRVGRPAPAIWQLAPGPALAGWLVSRPRGWLERIPQRLRTRLRRQWPIARLGRRGRPGLGRVDLGDFSTAASDNSDRFEPDDIYGQLVTAYLSAYSPLMSGRGLIVAASGATLWHHLLSEHHGWRGNDHDGHAAPSGPGASGRAGLSNLLPVKYRMQRSETSVERGGNWSSAWIVEPTPQTDAAASIRALENLQLDWLILDRSVQFAVDMPDLLGAWTRHVRPGGWCSTLFMGLGRAVARQQRPLWWVTPYAAAQLHHSVAGLDWTETYQRGNVATAMAWLFRRPVQELTAEQQQAVDPSYPLLSVATSVRTFAPEEDAAAGRDRIHASGQ